MIEDTNNLEGHGDPAPTPPAKAATALRQRAESQLRLTVGREQATLTPAATEGLLHELRVHQLELEMQNEELRRAQEALEVARARYFKLFDLAPVGYVTLNEAGVIQEANLAVATLLASPRVRLVGQPLTRFIFPEDQDIHYRCRKQLWATGERQNYELRLRRADGALLWVGLETSLELETEGEPPLWRVILIDIRARKQGERALLDTQARLRLVAAIAELTFWEWDPHTDEVFFPPEWRRQAGYGLGELPLRLREWAALLHPEDQERILACLSRFVSEHQAPHEIHYRLRCQDGQYRWFAVSLEAILDAGGALVHVLLVHQDVTRRKKSEEQAIRLAQNDSLTGLPSRALLDQLANHMLASVRRSGGQLAVLFFDLDHFKTVNDVYGHAVGDQLLRMVADRLRDAFRTEDLVARLGGDEFVAVLANIRDDAARVVRNAMAALTPAYQIDGLELHCVPSIGVSLFPQDGDTFERLIQRADLAMYHAKQISPGRYQFVTEALNRREQATVTLENRLREGLAREEFRIFYQPVLDTRSGLVTGVEALLRWPQADGSEIPPLALLPVAESSGLIHELGQWVFQEACRQHRAWQQGGLPPISIAVNVSARQFHHQRFWKQLAEAIRAAGVDPNALSLALSENVLVQDKQAARRVLGELKQLGVRVALDDFGMGCSSLSELEHLPLDQLEINRVLVRRLRSEGRMPAILEAIIRLGRALALNVSAVGIETKADFEFFRQCDCDQMQGFYLGAPMSGQDFAEWYGQHSAVSQ